MLVDSVSFMVDTCDIKITQMHHYLLLEEASKIWSLPQGVSKVFCTLALMHIDRAQKIVGL